MLSHRPMVSSGIDDALKEILQITLRKSIIVLQQLFLSFYESYLSVLLFIFSATYGAFVPFVRVYVGTCRNSVNNGASQ